MWVVVPDILTLTNKNTHKKTIADNGVKQENESWQM